MSSRQLAKGEEYATSGDLIDYVEVHQCQPPMRKHKGKYMILVRIDTPMQDLINFNETELSYKVVPQEHVEYLKKMSIKTKLKE